MVNSGTFESSHGQEGDKNVIASCLQPPTITTEGGPSDPEQSPEDKLRCSVPLEKLEGYQPEDLAKSKNRKLLCLYCDRTFVSLNLRQKHVERAHSSKNSRRVSSRKQNQLTATPCAHCDKLNNTENTLKDLFQHLVQEHPGKYFGCLPCEDRFLTQALLADHHVNVHRAVLPSDSVKSPAKTTLKETPPEELFQEKEVVIKITRSRVKPRQEEAAEEGKKKLKKLSVKSSRIALKKRESKRLQALAKIADGAKKRRAKPERKQLGGSKMEQQNSTKPEKAKASASAGNPYPEFDNFYRVKKITDHSIDNLKISSLTFDDVFDKAFFNRIKCNIEENLLHHIDGKLFKNEESESRISNFEKVSNSTQEIQNASSDNYGCELSLNAVTPVASLSLNSQYGEDFESQIEYGSKPSKKKTQTKTDQVFHYKYFTRRKFQASILQQKENRDLSKLDMWTQLVIRNRQQKIIDDKKTPKEIQEYASCDEYKSKLKREELNRILDRRGPFEDLKEEASKKAALDKLNSASADSISHESFTDIREILEDILARVFVATGEADAEEIEEKVEAKRDERELPSYLNLRRTSTLPSEGDIDRSDRIALICSSQETENYELPTNQARRQNELVELSGEWARCRLYVCAACGARLPNMKYLLDHKSLYHQNVWVQHYEFVGNQNELYRHLSIPALGKVGFIEDTFQGKLWRRSEARTCSKCGKQCNSLGELHRHILECGGDWSWMLARKKCKYRPCKSRRKRLRGLVHRIRHKENDGPKEKKKYKKAFEGPRQRPSDAETIQRMLANLPAKRSTRKLISLYDGVYRARKNNQIQQQNLNQKKVKCGKVIYKSSSIKENTEKTINTAPSGLKTQKPNQSSNRRSLRNMSRVLSSRILDTNANLNVKRKLKALSERRSTRQSKISSKIVPEVNPDQAATLEDTEQLEKAKAGEGKLENQFALTHKRTSPRSTPKNVKMMNVKKLLTGNINMKSFFPVKKQKSRKALRETQAAESTDKSVDPKTKIKRKSNEPEAVVTAREEKLDKQAEPKKTKSSAIKKIMKSLSLKKKLVKSSASNSPELELVQSDTQSPTSLTNVLSPVETDKSNNKRKLKRSFRNVINRVKRLKIDSAPETLETDTKEIATKSTFLGETNLEHPNQSVKIVIPSNSEAKENLADISESAHIATNFNKTSGDSPVPENIFKLGSSDEKSLQAKGDLDFDSQQDTDKIIKSTVTTEIIEDKTETEITQKTTPANEKIEPLTIETSEKPKIMPLVSPNIKGKIKKPTRGLNDCIAMLTSKLQQKTIEPIAKVGVFNLVSPTNAPRILSDPSPQKSDCILKIPNFKTQTEPSSLEETALDLSVKPKDQGQEVPIAKPEKTVKNPEAVFAEASKPYFEPFSFGIPKMPDLTNSVERIINSVIENNFQKESNHKIWKSWNTVDETIQYVIDGYHHKSSPVSSLSVTKNSVDDIIDFVATFGNDKEDINNKLGLILKQPGDRSKLKNTKKPSPSKQMKNIELLKGILSGPTLDSISIIPGDSISSCLGIGDTKKKYEDHNTSAEPVLGTVKAVAPNNLDITIENVVRDTSSIEEPKQTPVDPIVKTSVKKLSQFRRSKDKQKSITELADKPFVETHLDDVLDTKEVNCKPEVSSVNIKAISEDNVEKTEELTLTSEDEPLVLENKLVNPSDSEDDIPLAALLKPIEDSKNEATYISVAVEDSLSKLKQITSENVCEEIAGTLVKTGSTTFEEQTEDGQNIILDSTNMENTTTTLESRLTSSACSEMVENEASEESADTFIKPVEVEDSNMSQDPEEKQAHQDQRDFPDQVVNDSDEAMDCKVPVTKTKKSRAKKRSLSKKKSILLDKVTIETENSYPQQTADGTVSVQEPQTEISPIPDGIPSIELTKTSVDEIKTHDQVEESTPSLPLPPQTAENVATEAIKDDDVSNQEITTDSSFVKNLPFANEEILPDVLPTLKRNTNQRKRARKTKFSRKKPKRKNQVPVGDISKPTESLGLELSNEAPPFETENRIELSETSKEPSSSTLPNVSIPLGDVDESIDNPSLKTSVLEGDIICNASSTSNSMVDKSLVTKVIETKDGLVTETEMNHQCSIFSSIETNERLLEIPKSDGSLLSDGSKIETDVVSKQEIKTDSSLVKILPFANERTLPDDLPVPNRKNNQRRRAKKPKFSSKKTKRKNLVPIVDMLEGMSKLVGLEMSNESSPSETEKQTELSDTSKESSSSTLPNVIMPLNNEGKSLDDTIEGISTETTENNFEIPMPDDSISDYSKMQADVASHQVMRTDSLFAQDLPFANEEVLPDVLSVPKRNINQKRRAKKTKFSGKKSKRKNPAPTVDIFENTTKSTGSLGSEISNEPPSSETENHIEPSETSKESSSSTLPKVSISLSDEDISVDIANESELPLDKTSLNTTDYIANNSLTSDTMVENHLVSKVTPVTKTKIKQKSNHQLSRFSSIGNIGEDATSSETNENHFKVPISDDSMLSDANKPKNSKKRNIRSKIKITESERNVGEHMTEIISNIKKYLSPETDEHNFKIPLSDDSMLTDTSKPKNSKKRSIRSKIKFNKRRSRSLKLDIGMSSSDESSSSPVKLRSRSLKKHYREPSSDDSPVNARSELELTDSDTLLSEISTKRCLRTSKNDTSITPPLIDEGPSLNVNTTANFISETLITLRKELGLPTEDLSKKNAGELTLKRSARLSTAILSSQDDSSTVIEAIVDPKDPEAESLEVQKTSVAEMVFKTPTKKRNSRKIHLAVWTDESDLNESNTEDTPNKKRPLRSAYNQLTSESETEDSSHSDASLRTKTRRGSRSLVNEFKEPSFSELQSKVHDEELPNCESKLEVETEGFNSDQKTKIKHVSNKKRGKTRLVTSIESTGNSESSDSDFVDFQSKRPLRKLRSLNNGTVSVLDVSKPDSIEETVNKLADSDENDFEAKRPKRSSRLLNNNVNIPAGKTDELLPDAPSELSTDKKTNAPRKNGKNEQSLEPDTPSQSVDEIDGMNDSLQRQNSRSLRKKSAINYSEIEENTFVIPDATEETIQTNDKNSLMTKNRNDKTIGNTLMVDVEPINTISDLISERVETDVLEVQIIPPVDATPQDSDLTNPDVETDESALMKPAPTVSKKFTKKKKKKNAGKSKILNQLPPLVDSKNTQDIAVVTCEPITEDNSKSDTAIVAPLFPSETADTEPPIKIIINKQKARRKSKSIKKIDSKGPNDLFQDFALVIKKKRTTPFMSFSPPDTFSKEDTDAYSLFPPKPLEIQQVLDKKDDDHFIDKKDEDHAELDVSVEEMDMELDEIPINASIIENTLNLSLPLDHETDELTLFDSPKVEVNPVTKPLITKTTRNGRKNKHSKNKGIIDKESETEMSVDSKDISSLVMEEYSELPISSAMSNIEEVVKKDMSPEDQQVEEPRPVKKTSKKSKEKLVEGSTNLGIPSLSHIGKILDQDHPEEEKLNTIVKSPIGFGRQKTVNRRSKGKFVEKYAEFDDLALPPIKDTPQQDLFVEEDLNKSVESSKPIKTKKAKGKSVEKFAEFGNPALPLVENPLENDLSVEEGNEMSKPIKKTSKKGKGKSLEVFPQFDIPALPPMGDSSDKALLVEEHFNIAAENPIVERPETRQRPSRKAKSMVEYSEFGIVALPPIVNTLEKALLVEKDLDAIVKNPISVEKRKSVKRNSNNKGQGKYIEDFAEIDIPELPSLGNTSEKDLLVENLDATLKNSIGLEKTKTVKRTSNKVKGLHIEEYAEFDFLPLPPMVNTLEKNLLLEEDLGATVKYPIGVEKRNPIERTSNKAQGKSVKEFAQFDIPGLPSLEKTLEKDVLVENLDATSKNPIGVEKPKLMKRTSKKALGKHMEECTEFDIPVIAPMEDALDKDQFVEDHSDIVAKSAIVEKPKSVQRASRKTKEKSVKEYAMGDIIAKDLLLEENSDIPIVEKPKTIQRTSIEVKAKSSEEYADFDILALPPTGKTDEQNILVEEQLDTIAEKPKPVKKAVKKVKKKSKNRKSSNHLLTSDDMTTEDREKSPTKPLTEMSSEDNCLDVLNHKSFIKPQISAEMLLSKLGDTRPLDDTDGMSLLNDQKFNNPPPLDGAENLQELPLKDKDIDLIYAFSETEDLEINTPIELPKRLPRFLLKTTPTANDSDQKDEQQKAKKKPKQKKISTLENEEEDIETIVKEIKENGIDLEENGRRKPMRSAKVKALEYIHDDALAELSESERNRVLKSSKAIQNENEADIETSHKKNKKQKKNETAPELIETASFSYEALAEDEAPLLAELVAELHGLEELENSIERELNADMNERNKLMDTTDSPDQTVEEPTLEESLPNTGGETISEENQELRRSRRGSRKVASYNENDLIDPIIDALENKRIAKKKDTKAVENKNQKKTKDPEKKLNSDQLFDLLKASTTESVYVPKQQNSFLDNLGDISRYINDDNFDTVFGDLREKNKDSDKIYDFNDSSLTTEQVAMNKSLILSKQSDDSSLSSSSYKLLTPDIQDSSTSEESKSKLDTVVDSNYCEICSKSFIRVENLVKHRRTLTHIQKLSEIEAKEAELKLQQDQIAQEIPNTFTNKHSLKLADIISDVLNKPVLVEEASKFPDIVLQNTSKPEVKRYKSLGERKSFESDNNLLQESKTTILEKQISLLEDIIENKANNSYIDDISSSSDDSLLSSKQDITSKNKSTKTIDDDSFLKPTQYEEISEDSANQRHYEDQKLRKTLNRDEELFLECCSLLKSGSEVSSSYSSKKMANKDVGPVNVRQPDWMEKKNLVQPPELDLDDDYSDDNSRIPTPLGDSFDDDASNSNTISSDWGVNGRETCAKEDGSARLNFQGISAEKRDSSDLKFQDLLKTNRSPFTQDLPTKSPTVEPSKTEEIDTKKIITKGARKVFEGLKVSIPTEELNLEEVLNCSPKPKKLEVQTISDTSPSATTKPAKNARKSKPVKKSQVGSNILFKVNKKKLLSPTALPQPTPENQDKDTKSYDVYDFEETQDNTEVFAKSDFKAFRHTKTGELELEPEPISSSVKKSKDQENITKKKCMIMGRIFKNAAKSKIEDIDDEIRTIPTIDNGELVEKYVASCNEAAETDKKQKLSENEMNQLFAQLLDTKPERDNPKQPKPKPETKKPPEQKKKPKPKGKKRARTNSESTDDEFSLNTNKRRSGKKNGKEEDNCINLEQELKECIGVASRKSQRSCTSGKQNILMEYWSSDDSQFEAMLEKQIIEVKPKKQQIIDVKSKKPPVESKKPPVEEPVSVAMATDPVPPMDPADRKKKRSEKKKTLPADDSLAGESNKESNRRKRAAANPLYHWSSSSEDETSDLIEVRPAREEAEEDEERPVQHGWIVGESPKKLVMMLAQAKGKKTDIDGVKEQGKRRTGAVS
ncbi:unnamed protein product [Phaedon cochleariae]|uniref:C2H2-type domain-containing protein n=1 Tax=Phaedon cochleariae TaxID=80249 RepID=A0A9P0DUY8_PHACE|nr:unnamed protein product [Phaedon cochleariae]